MRETRRDTVLAVTGSVLVHLLLVAVFVASMWWPSKAGRAGAGGAITAEMVDARALPSAVRQALRNAPEPLPEPSPPEPEPLPEPLEEQPEAQEQLLNPDDVSQDEVRADAEAAETAAREQEAKMRQGQVDLDAERKQEEEQRNRVEQQRAAELRRIQAERERLRREQAEAQANLDAIALREANRASNAAASAAANTRPASAPGIGAGDDGLLGRYAAAIQADVEPQWRRSAGTRPGQLCNVRVVQARGGIVRSAKVEPGCPYDEEGKRRVENAIMLASPLPYDEFREVFQRELVIEFEAPP